MDCNPYHRTGLKQFCLSIVLSNNNSDNTKVIKEHNWSSQGGFIFGTSWSLDWFWNISFLFPFYCLVFKEITDSTRKEQKKQKKKKHPKNLWQNQTYFHSWAISEGHILLYIIRPLWFILMFRDKLLSQQHFYISLYQCPSIKLTVMLITHTELIPCLSIRSSWALEPIAFPRYLSMPLP